MRQRIDKDFRITFANAFRIRLGDNDCGLTFVVEADDPEGPYQSDQIQVAMTPRTLKLLNFAVSKVLERLEEAVGPIPLPEEKTRALAAALGPPPATKSK
jgi:hypothetical protein